MELKVHVAQGLQVPNYVNQPTCTKMAPPDMMPDKNLHPLNDEVPSSLHPDFPKHSETYQREMEKSPKVTYKQELVWRNILIFAYLHIASLYAIYLIFTSAKLATFIFAALFGFIGGFGITVGAHRLWSHRSFKAKWPLRVFLCILQTIAFQNHIYEWSRDHRVHHKFTETDADPHNAKRGFFFSHIGWLLIRKHPDVKEKGKLVDMSDLEKDWVVMFQKKYYLWLMPFFAFILPTLIPVYFWNETLYNSWLIAAVLRYTLTVNGTWCINSWAHFFGSKPYDKNIRASQDWTLSMITSGEGWHNYHHVFPWDYKAAELGDYNSNKSTAFIDFCAKLGLAYDLKTVPIHIVRKRVLRTGDGSHPFSKEHSHEGQVWGWGDKDMTNEDQNYAEIYFKSNEM